MFPLVFVLLCFLETYVLSEKKKGLCTSGSVLQFSGLCPRVTMQWFLRKQCDWSVEITAQEQHYLWCFRSDTNTACNGTTKHFILERKRTKTEWEQGQNNTERQREETLRSSVSSRWLWRLKVHIYHTACQRLSPGCKSGVEQCVCDFSNSVWERKSNRLSKLCYPLEISHGKATDQRQNHKISMAAK